uniref:Uncharacterized protein n=1 Tax=Oryza sativa subsp. japonica TaxID=39947 RepID=Q8W5F1_ORYSJ|nr:hypothetical protein [Oryza sativa Japonica Group]
MASLPVPFALLARAVKTIGTFLSTDSDAARGHPNYYHLFRILEILAYYAAPDHNAAELSIHNCSNWFKRINN